MRVFVYGTLKLGYWNNHYLGKDAVFLGEKVVPGYKLIGGEGIPAARKDHGSSVHGQLFEIPNDPQLIYELDSLESAYRREEFEPDTWIYVGSDRYWSAEHADCSKNDKGLYVWETKRVKL